MSYFFSAGVELKEFKVYNLSRVEGNGAATEKKNLFVFSTLILHRHTLSGYERFVNLLYINCKNIIFCFRKFHQRHKNKINCSTGKSRNPLHSQQAQTNIMLIWLHNSTLYAQLPLNPQLCSLAIYQLEFSNWKCNPQQLC